METKYWFVEKVTGINRFVLISGFNENRVIWKDDKGMSDFIRQSEAQLKANELNKP